MDVAWSAPRGAHFHADVIYLLPLLGIKKGARALWNSEGGLHQLSSRPTIFILRWTTRPYILYQVCATRGATVVVALCLASFVFVTTLTYCQTAHTHTHILFPPSTSLVSLLLREGAQRAQPSFAPPPLPLRPRLLNKRAHMPLSLENFIRSLNPL